MQQVNLIMRSEREALNFIIQLEALKERLDHLEKGFPLYTVQGLAERWGVSYSAVDGRTLKKDFPLPVLGIVAKTRDKEMRLYKHSDVVRYEKEKGLLK